MAANVQQVQLRGSYQQIIDQDRGRLIHAFENDDADYIAVANTLGIKHSTSRSIVANYLRTGRCGKLAKRGCEKRTARYYIDDAKKQEHKRLMIDDNPILKRWYRWKMILPKASESTEDSPYLLFVSGITEDSRQLLLVSAILKQKAASCRNAKKCGVHWVQQRQSAKIWGHRVTAALKIGGLWSLTSASPP